MQKLILTIICFFLPTLTFLDFNPVCQLIIIGFLYDAKVVVGLLILSLAFAILSVAVFFKLLFREFRIEDFIKLMLLMAISWITFFSAKTKLKNLHLRPFRLLRNELILISEFHNIKRDLMQSKNNIIVIKTSVKKVLNIYNRKKSKGLSGSNSL